MGRHPRPAVAARRAPRRRRFLRTWLRAFLLVLGVLAVARGVLPAAVAAHVNRVLDAGEETQGSIGRIEMNLWRGAYEVEHVALFQVTSVAEEPLLEVGRLDLAVDRSALLDGDVVGRVGLVEPHLTLVLGPAGEQTGAEQDWQDRLDALFPFRVERLVARRGRIDLVALERRPPIDVWVEDVQLLVQDLSNVRDPSRGALPAEAVLTGRPFGEGWLRVELEFDPLADPPRFDLDLALEDVDVRKLNDLLVAYAGVDAEAGTFHLFAELAAREGRVEGYVKPFFEGLQVASWRDVRDPTEALEAFWEALVEVADEVLDREPGDRLATRVPISGPLERPDAGLWSTVAGLLGNAFVRALSPSVEGTVDLRDVGREAAP